MSLTGFPQRLENLENENGHGKVTEHEKFPTNFAKFVFFSVTIKNLSSDLESLHFPTFST